MAPGVDGPNCVSYEVVAHREILRVVPHRGDRVAVVIAHHHGSCRDRCSRELALPTPVLRGNLFINPLLTAFCSSRSRGPDRR